MSYTQYTSETELDEGVGDGTFFVTEDHRAYKHIGLVVRGGTTTLDAEVLGHLMDLQSHLEMVDDNLFEMNFKHLVEEAKEVEEIFSKTLAAIKFKPIKWAKAPK